MKTGIVAILVIVAAVVWIVYWEVDDRRRNPPPSSATPIVVKHAPAPTTRLAASSRPHGPVLSVHVLTGPADGLFPVAFSPDSKLVASGGGDKLVHLWDVDTGKEVRTLEGHVAAVMSLDFSPDGKYLVSGSSDGQLVASNVATGEVEGIWKQPCPVWHVAFLPDAVSFVSSCGENLRLWKIGEMAQLRAMTGDDTLQCVAVPKDRGVITGDGHGTLTWWDTGTGEVLAKHSRPQADFAPQNRIVTIAILKSGEVLITDCDRIWKWDLKSDVITPTSMMGVPGMVPADHDQCVIGVNGPMLTVQRFDNSGRTTFGSIPRLDYAAAYKGRSALTVSPSGEFVAWTHGARFDENVHWMPGPPGKVELYSTEAVLEMEREDHVDHGDPDMQTLAPIVLPPPKVLWN